MSNNKEYEPGSLEGIRAGIRWREKLDYGKSLSGYISIWFTLVLILQIMGTTVAMMVLGCLYSLYFGTKAGGNEVHDGAEEFSFSLAVPRPERFKVKFLYGFIPLLITQIAGLLTIKYNLSQYFWGLFVDSGLNAPYHFANGENLMFYSVALLIPLCLYITVFSACIISWNPASLPGAVFKGILMTGIAGIAAAVFYHNTDLEVACLLTFLLTVMIAVFYLHHAYRIYSYKEGHSTPQTSQSRGGNASLAVIAIIVLFVLFFLFFLRAG